MTSNFTLPGFEKKAFITVNLAVRYFGSVLKVFTYTTTTTITTTNNQ